MDRSRRRTTGSGGPKFFKIVDASSVTCHKLSLPRNFASRYREDLGSIVHLRVPSGAVWEIELISSDNDMFLAKGWEEFAKYYSIGLWHFLVFTYKGNSTFSVVIFNQNAAEIEYPLRSLARNCKTVNKEYIEIDDSDQESEEIHEKKNLATGGGSSIALGKAKAFESENPFFVVCLKQSHVSPTGCLNIPTEFAREHISEQQQYVELKVGGKKWEVRCYFSHTKDIVRYRLNCHSFLLDNGIELGDVCVFELTDPVKLMFNVKIFREQELREI